jgi:ribA/ribD-fused uncharacterized protein
MAIYFYSKNEENSWLSNFSPHGVEMDGLWFPTVEHYFQAQKFHDEDYREKIRIAKTPAESKTLGRSRKVKLRDDWEEVKEEIMHAACLKKFQAHPELCQRLLSTGDEELIESAPNDYFWGCGRNGSGQNKLGQILMQVREELKHIK